MISSSLGPTKSSGSPGTEATTLPVRGVDQEAFRQEYQKYLNLWDNASSKGDINLSWHGDYLGL